MRSTLIDLWNGNISPWSEPEKPIEDIRTLVGLIEKNGQKLIALLNDDGKKILEAFEDCHNELTFLEREDAFVRGFSLGVKITTEALGED